MRKTHSAVILTAILALAMVFMLNVSEVKAAPESTLIVSYTITGGGKPEAPIINYVDVHGKEQKCPLNTTADRLLVKKGSKWSVTPGNTIVGSEVEQWFSKNETWSGTAPANGKPRTYVWCYTHQLKVSFDVTRVLKTDTSSVVVTVAGSDKTAAQLPYTTNWINSGTPLFYSFESPLASTSHPLTTYYTWNSTIGLHQTLQKNTFPVTTAGTITGNYLREQSQTNPIATSLTVACSPETVNKLGTETTFISGTLSSKGIGVAGKTVGLSYFDGLQWTQMATATTAKSGGYQYSWDVPSTLANGPYAVKAEFAGDAAYKPCSATTGTFGNGGHLFVVPEYLWGGLTALVACFVALVVFKKRGKRSS
ncbi:MAG: hypothetical protein NWF00_12455 [Candidatus Bathyarchaeota archaeon]|nr:hypothetical protein [Candidatus Bathyarchaeota archaeon]